MHYVVNVSYQSSRNQDKDLSNLARRFGGVSVGSGYGINKRDVDFAFGEKDLAKKFEEFLLDHYPQFMVEGTEEKLG